MIPLISYVNLTLRPLGGDLVSHLKGEIAKALFARADELLASPPQIEMLEILAAK